MQTPYKTYKLDDTCTVIEEGHVRCFLIEGSSRALLVDTGLGGGDLASLVQSLTKLPIILVNTHADRDHIGANYQFAEVFMHPAEYDRYNTKDGDSCTVQPLWEEDKIDLGGRVFRVILIPGHTPGSIALLDEENGVLISGDTVQNGQTFMFGPGRNKQAFMESLKKLMTLSFKTIYPSHGDVPLAADFMQDFFFDAKDVFEGRIEGEDTMVFGNAVKLHCGKAGRFLCDPVLKPEV